MRRLTVRGRSVSAGLLALMATLVFGSLLLLRAEESLLEGQQTSPGRGAQTRTCDPDADALRTKKKPKKKDQIKSLPGAACIEVRETGLAVQEHLQKFIREQRWSIGEEQLSEDSWSFSRYLKKEEIGAYAEPWKGTPIEWRSAIVKVNVRTTDLPEGFARSVVTARIEGYGEPEDQFATKRESWTLQSNGALETSLTEALRKQLEMRTSP